MSFFFFLVNMVVLSPCVDAESANGVLVGEEAAGLGFKGGLDFETVSLTRSGGMFWMKVTVTINLTCMESYRCRVLLTDLLLLLIQSQTGRGARNAACQDQLISFSHLKYTENTHIQYI